jgi:hypothetical protein
MTNMWWELSKYALVGASSAFLMLGATIMYGDETVTQYALLMTGIYFVGVSVFAFACSYLVEKKP